MVFRCGCHARHAVRERSDLVKMNAGTSIPILKQPAGHVGSEVFVLPVRSIYGRRWRCSPTIHSISSTDTSWIFPCTVIPYLLTFPVGLRAGRPGALVS